MDEDDRRSSSHGVLAQGSLKSATIFFFVSFFKTVAIMRFECLGALVKIISISYFLIIKNPYAMAIGAQTTSLSGNSKISVAMDINFLILFLIGALLFWGGMMLYSDFLRPETTEPWENLSLILTNKGIISTFSVLHIFKPLVLIPICLSSSKFLMG